MLFIHLEYIVGGCFQDFGILGQDHCLQDIDHLGNICHSNTVTVLVKNIQRGSGDNGIPHGVLLIQECRIRARLYIIPGTPFIHKQVNIVVWIVFIHDRQMLFDNILDMKCIGNGTIIFFVAKVGCTSPMLPVARHRIAVETDAVGLQVVDTAHELFRPVVVLGIWSAGYLV